MKRRNFIQVAGVGAAGLWAGCAATPPRIEAVGAVPAKLIKLPAGNAPAPVPAPHFPTRFHAFVWRNWPLVPAPRLAKVVACRASDIERVARAMGLGVQPRITEEAQRRSHLTVIRRNWHLLPYDQLLVLLDWSPEQLAYTLREDDFLFIKLGSHKPQCEPVRWMPPEASITAREEGMARIVRENFPEGVNSREPLFNFVKSLSAKNAALPITVPSSSGLRLCYSYFALYGDPLLEPELDPYPDGYLAQLAATGVNAVWLQAVLHKLAPFPWQPELSARHEERLKNLRQLATRARRHGLAIYLYLNEPRSMPLAFFESHAELKGVVQGDHATLCTSHVEVQQWMRDSVELICRSVPALGGFFTITASENLTNCWSHGTGANCPRCRLRPPAEIIAGVNAIIVEGIRRAQPMEKNSNCPPAPQLLAWDWGWNDAWAPDIISRLPPECALMSVSEWSLPIERGGVKSTVGEYSISSIGPGPRAQRHWQLARQRGLRVIAKIQANVSWELSAVPYIPALENVAQHAANLRAAGVEDVMLGWTLGGHPSPNLEIVQALLRPGATNSTSEALREVATRRFGPHATTVLGAWHEFSAAFSEFPYHIGLAYSGPQQLGPANLLFAQPSGYQATMVGFPYDDLVAWRAIYPTPTFIAQFEKVAEGFGSGVAILREALPAHPVTGADRALVSELSVASACELHFRSVVNQSRFVVARDALAKVATSTEAAPLLTELERLLQSEIRLAQQLHAGQCADARIGFEASNQYYYVPGDLVEKVLNARELLDRWLPAQHARWP